MLLLMMFCLSLAADDDHHDPYGWVDRNRDNELVAVRGWAGDESVLERAKESPYWDNRVDRVMKSVKCPRCPQRGIITRAIMSFMDVRDGICCEDKVSPNH